MDPLFPELPEDLSALSDEELATLLREHEVAAQLIDAEDEDFIKGMAADEVLAAYETGVEQIERIRAEQEARLAAEEAYQAQKEELQKRRMSALGLEVQAEEAEETEDGDEADAGAVDEEGGEEAEEAELSEESSEESSDEEAASVAALSAGPPAESPAPRSVVRRPPRPSGARQVAEEHGAMLVASSGLQDYRAGAPLDRMSLAKAMRTTAIRRGKPEKSNTGVEEKIRVASAQFRFPDDRVLDASDWERNAEKIKQVIPGNVPGMDGLVASGGLCAPLTPLYTMPNFAVQDRPVRDALPSFQADRGGVNVPAATTIGDITTAITTITSANDAAGGTFATKSCQALTCPAYTETPVTIISHCREYGNLNARAWPEKIAHENDLTMAALARTAEGYLLDRIKTQSVNVTNGVDTLGALIYLVDGIVKAGFGIRGRLRMGLDSTLRVLLPAILPDMLQLDTVQTPNEGRFNTDDDLVAYLRSYMIEPTFYLDTPSTGTSQLPDASQTAAALDGLPANVQWAIYPEGSFIHVDGGSLELGIVRDSTLNSTNDFQIFGEVFENVARIGPSQGCYWVTTNLCPTGQFAPAGTVRTCE